MCLELCPEARSSPLHPQLQDATRDCRRNSSPVSATAGPSRPPLQAAQTPQEQRLCADLGAAQGVAREQERLLGAMLGALRASQQVGALVWAGLGLAGKRWRGFWE